MGSGLREKREPETELRAVGDALPEGWTVLPAAGLDVELLGGIGSETDGATALAAAPPEAIARVGGALGAAMMSVRPGMLAIPS